MSTKAFTRLRQVCLATLDIKKHQNAFQRIFETDPCHESWLEQFGLENALFPIGGTFIELVAPIKENTAVHRFLARSKGTGGYMAIFDCDDLNRKRSITEKLGIPLVYHKEADGASLIQLSPKATGLTLVEFDQHKNGEDRFGSYEWAGPGWQDRINQHYAEDVVSFEFHCADPTSKASTWSELFETPLVFEEKEGASLKLEYGNLHFHPNTTSQTDCFSAIQIKTQKKSELLSRAEEEGYSVSDDHFQFCGIDLRFVD